MFLVLMKCRGCGRIYDPYQDLRSLDYELCPECNHSRKEAERISIVCEE